MTQIDVRPAHLRLREMSDQILNAFVEELRAEVGAAAKERKSILVNSLPDFLEQLEKKLHSEHAVALDKKVEEAGKEHAEQRIHLTNFSLKDLLIEYQILRQLIFRSLQVEGPLTTRESSIINEVIDSGVVHAGQRYIELTEARLSESHEHFRLLIEGTFDHAIFLLSPEGIVQTWNKGAERMKGYKGEEIIGKHFSVFYSPEMIQRRHPDHELKIAAKEGKFEEEGLRIRKNGTSFQAHVVINALKDETGNITGFSKVTQDLSERKVAEENFRAFANSIKQLAWMADEHGTFNWYNDQWYEYTGTTLEEMKGAGWQDVQHPDEHGEMLKKWSRSIETGEPFDMVLSLKSAKGEYHSFLTNGVPFKNADGRIIKWFGTNTNIQPQKDVEQKLALANVYAQNALRARDEFISIASHELKTPLTSLLLQMQMRSRKILKGDLAEITPEQMRSMIETDQRQLQRITRLIDDMLDVEKINTGNLTVTFEPFSICKLAEEVLLTYQDIFQTMGSTVDVTYEHDIVGPWDRFRIEQALVNLLMNACKYGGNKGVHIKVSRDETWMNLSVEDQGMGIAPENLDRVFERFERAVDKCEVSGLGLGLFITKQIVLAHAGHIRVKSELGKGSTFTIQLPLDLH